MMKALSLLPGAIALMLAAAPVLPSLTYSAAAAPNRVERQARGGMQKLNLSDDQKAKIKQIRETARQRMQAVLTEDQKTQMQQARQQRQRPKLNLSDDQKAQLKAIRQDTENQIRGVLNADQQKQWDQMRQQAKQRMQQRRSQGAGTQQ